MAHGVTEAPVPGGEPAVTVRNLDVEFQVPGASGDVRRRALADISLDIADGELVVLVGKSGCGKTTLLNVLAGLVQPTRGSLQIGDLDAGEARDQIGYMFARDALLAWRTARRNVEFALELRRPELSRRERRRLAVDFLEQVGLGESTELYPWQLSQGMRQRTALARTWAIDPALLLMDEPFAALDAQTRAQVQDRFLDLWAESGRTIVFVTHDLSEAVLLADRVVVLAEGRQIDEIEIDIPRPRHADTIVDDPRFRAIHQRLVSDINPPTATDSEND